MVRPPIALTSICELVLSVFICVVCKSQGVDNSEDSSQTRQEGKLVWIDGGIGSGTARFNYRYGAYAEVSSIVVGVSHFFAIGEFNEVKKDNLHRTINNSLDAWQISIGKQFVSGSSTILLLPRISYQSTEILTQEYHYYPPVLFPGSWDWAFLASERQYAFALGVDVSLVYDYDSYSAYSIQFALDYSKLVYAYSIDFNLVFYVAK
jgi:hypothetical protein